VLPLNPAASLRNYRDVAPITISVDPNCAGWRSIERSSEATHQSAATRLL
jgi:hypothetical protein